MNPDLGVLKLGDNSIGDEGVRGLAQGLKENRQLTELYLDQNYISDIGLTALAGALNNKIATLSLNRNQISGSGVIDLADGLLDPNSLTNLSLSDNQLETKALQSFQIALKMSKLTKLTLSINEQSQQMEKALVDLVCEVQLLLAKSHILGYDYQLHRESGSS
jgi:Ran GTPase-activating protein (RanGAP) involved in mRNA processing and transport